MTTPVNTEMKKRINSDLLRKALIRYLISALFVGLLIFVPAGSLRFWNGWLFMGSLFIPMLFVMAYLILYDPELLVKRLKTDEKEKTQKIYLILSILFCFVIFCIPGFDYRFGWSHLPFWLIILSTIIMLAAYFLFFLCMKQNTFASRVIELQDKQKIIDTGLYGIIRHPMYFSGSVLFMSAPVVLGSIYAHILSLFIPVLLIIRLLNEEKVLKKGLDGYEDYMKKVKFRLIPYIW